MGLVWIRYRRKSNHSVTFDDYYPQDSAGCPLDKDGNMIPDHLNNNEHMWKDFPNKAVEVLFIKHMVEKS